MELIDIQTFVAGLPEVTTVDNFGYRFFCYEAWPGTTVEEFESDLAALDKVRCV